MALTTRMILLQSGLFIISKVSTSLLHLASFAGIMIALFTCQMSSQADNPSYPWVICCLEDVVFERKGDKDDKDISPRSGHVLWEEDTDAT
jgi:hypothetical protein